MRRIALLHTVHSVIPALDQLFRELVPGARPLHLLEESILQEAIARGGATPAVHDRVARLAQLGQEGGAEAVLVTCSSISPCADSARERLSIPVFRIDEPMAAEAATAGTRVAVLGTLATTLEPSTELVRAKAREAGREVEVRPFLCRRPPDTGQQQGKSVRDAAVLHTLDRAAEWGDVLVLAQASMAAVLSRHDVCLGKPVLTSPRSGMLQLRTWLERGAQSRARQRGPD